MKTRNAFALVVSLFFIWGFITELDGALIPYLKDVFELSDFKAALVQFAFFIAFVTMSAPSAWLLDRIGFGRGIVVGLFIMAVGSFLFFPASTALSYPIFLSAIFVLAIGVTILQVAANPYVTLLGPPETGSNRLNLAQGINSLAKVIAPFFGAYFILRGLENMTKLEQAAAVQMPYIFLGTCMLVVAIIFAFIKLPEPEEAHEEVEDLPDHTATSVMQFPHLLKGAGAIFFYVGVEVSVATFLVLFLGQPEIAGLSRSAAAVYLSYYWGGLMVGRLSGAYILKYISPQRLLAICAVMAAVCILTVVFSTGKTAMWALILTGLFHSIMWSNIFALSIKGLGKFTSKGSAVLVACIVGGALIPPLQGLLSDTYGRQESFLILIIGYVYILYFGLYGYKPKETHDRQLNG